MSEENEDGQLALSIRRIEYQRAWERVRQLQKEDATIYSEVLPQIEVGSCEGRRFKRIYPWIPYKR